MSEKIITEEEKQMLHVLNGIPSIPVEEPIKPVEVVFLEFANALYALIKHPFCPDGLGAELIDVVFNNAYKLGVSDAAMTARHHLIDAGILLAEQSEFSDDAA